VLDRLVQLAEAILHQLRQTDRSLATGRLSGSALIRGSSLGAAEYTEICRAQGTKPRQWTVMTSATDIAATGVVPVAATARIFFRILIGGGNEGGGAGTVVRYALAGQPVVVSGASVYVQAVIAANDINAITSGGFGPSSPTANPGAKTWQATVTAIILPGDQSDLMPSMWTGAGYYPAATVLRASSQLIVGPSILKQLIAFNTTGTLEYLQIFDSAVAVASASGIVPLYCFPLDGLPTPPSAPVVLSLDNITSGRVFQHGIFWGASSDPATYVADDGALIRVDAEVYSMQLDVGLPMTRQ
jgi:hypothetical protein